MYRNDLVLWKEVKKKQNSDPRTINSIQNIDAFVQCIRKVVTVNTYVHVILVFYF